MAAVHLGRDFLLNQSLWGVFTHGDLVQAWSMHGVD